MNLLPLLVRCPTAGAWFSQPSRSPCWTPESCSKVMDASFSTACLNRSPVRRAGFTLVEQLVVMGLIVVLVGLLGTALNDRSSQGVGLQAAQATAAGMLRLARQEAVNHQVSVRLLVFVSPSSSDEAQIHLRGLQIVRADPMGSADWIAASELVFLPRTVCVVPPTLLPTQLCEGVLWPTGPGSPVSTLLGPERITVAGKDFGTAFYLQLLSDGKPDPATTELALATVRRSAGSLPRFDDPLAVRGLILRSTGEATSIDHASSF